MPTRAIYIYVVFYAQLLCDIGVHDDKDTRIASNVKHPIICWGEDLRYVGDCVLLSNLSYEGVRSFKVIPNINIKR